MEEFITIQEASQVLGITTAHLRKMLDSGIIPSINIAIGTKRKRLRIKKADIDTFVTNGGVQNG